MKEIIGDIKRKALIYEVHFSTAFIKNNTITDSIIIDWFVNYDILKRILID